MKSALVGTFSFLAVASAISSTFLSHAASAFCLAFGVLCTVIALYIAANDNQQKKV